MVNRLRDKQLAVKITEDELMIVEDFCEASGIGKSRLIYDLIEKIKIGEYEY